MIVVENVSHAHGPHRVLHDVSLAVPRGGVTALIGPNGAGKSTLLSLIGRLQPLQAGRITVDGLPVDATPGRELAKRLAILRQDGAVASRLRVRELVGFGRFPHSRGRLTAEDRAHVERALDAFGVRELADRFVDTLSGGQRQRALIAMAFAQDTPVLLLDEPLNNLDMLHARELMRRLRAAADAEAKTIVAVLHDINHAAAYADRIVALRDGRVVADGAPCDLLTPETLATVFGQPLRVERVDGTPVVLHHL
ncbi:ABC transporter ATP-binding protein [Methylopila musalis]|uniref:ABC transporter ATP-binding protein n=1 Tax=Methylopila musalis TaxID=1134781 RepID=A0ABW3Z5Z3_9HYPH